MNTSRISTPTLILIILSLLVLIATPMFGQYSLYQDYKATRIGDLITIQLQENVSGRSNTESSNRGSNSASADGSVTGNLSPFLPLFGANAAVNYQSDDDISANQSQLIRGTVSARIEDIMPNGDLYLVGSRKTKINGEVHTIEIKGFVRPNDITDQNMVLSYRIANAEIIYEKDNSAANVVDQPGFWRTALWVTLGAGLGVAAYLGIF